MFIIQLGNTANNRVLFKHFGSSTCWRRTLLGDVISARNEQQAFNITAKICHFLIEETQHVLLQVIWLKNKVAQIAFSSSINVQQCNFLGWEGWQRKMTTLEWCRICFQSDWQHWIAQQNLWLEQIEEPCYKLVWSPVNMWKVFNLSFPTISMCLLRLPSKRKCRLTWGGHMRCCRPATSALLQKIKAAFINASQAKWTTHVSQTPVREVCGLRKTISPSFLNFGKEMCA